MRAEISLGCVTDTAADQSFLVPLVTTDGPPAEAREELFRFKFGCSQSTSPGGIGINLEPLFGNAEEIWVTHSPAKLSQKNGINIARCSEYLFASAEIDIPNSAKVADKVYEIYRDLLESTISSEYPHLIRAWNYLPLINEGTGDTERYRQFSVGRAKAFNASNVSHKSFPAGTAIGVRNSSLLQVVLLAGRNPAEMVENPRQTSAYQYPRRYGPVGPTFARASQFSTSHTRQFWISGTASIVGSDSCHPGNTEQQLEETLQNIRELANTGGYSTENTAIPAAPVFRVYLREDANHDYICQRIQEEFGEHACILLLRGDICRSELLIEIECIFWSE